MVSKYGAGSFDDKLFVAILTSGFSALHRLGELVVPDAINLQDARKVISITSLTFGSDDPSGPSWFSYFLPGHKGNRFFEGNTVVITSRTDTADAVPCMREYIACRSSNPDTCARMELFLREDGSLPTRSWFMRYLRSNFGHDIAGHSLRSGGATDLALRGVPDELIQKIGRWASEAFQIYIRKNPALLAALVGLARPPPLPRIPV